MSVPYLLFKKKIEFLWQGVPIFFSLFCCKRTLTFNCKTAPKMIVLLLVCTGMYIRCIGFFLFSFHLHLFSNLLLALTRPALSCRCWLNSPKTPFLTTECHLSCTLSSLHSTPYTLITLCQLLFTILFYFVLLLFFCVFLVSISWFQSLVFRFFFSFFFGFSCWKLMFF